MPSLKTALVLTAIAVAAYILFRLARSPAPGRTLAASETDQRRGNSAGQRYAEHKHAQARHYQTPGDRPIVIDADRREADRGDADRRIEPELAAALDQADVEIRHAEDQNVGDRHSSPGHSGTRDNPVLLQDSAAADGADQASPYGPNVSISDAELIEPGAHSSTGEDALSDPDNGVHPADDDSSDKPPGSDAAVDADAAELHTDPLVRQIECNSSQLLLVDGFTDVLLSNDTLCHSVQRVAAQARQNRLARSKINAEQQRKLILADARASKQREDLQAEKKVRLSAEKQVARQQDEIRQIRRQLEEARQTLALRDSALAEQEAQLTRSRMMARSAAKLARRAAVTQQQAMDMAQSEKQRRHQVESRTQQAISIARNAISALAEQEKKNRIDSLAN